MDVLVEAQPVRSPEKICDEKVEIEDALIKHISVEYPINMENRDLILTAVVSICNKPVKFLVDTGAHATIINFKTLKQNILYYPQIKYCMTGINGLDNAVKTHGATYGNIILNGVKLRQQMQIAGDDIYLNYDGILGLDFLYSYGVIMNLRSLAMRVLLPAWHELYEETERQMFEKKEPVSKMLINNDLVYRNVEPKNPNELPKNEREEKKFEKTMQLRINQLSLMDLSKKSIKKSIKIMPHSQKNVRIYTGKTILCKAKEHSPGVFSAETIIDDARNILTIYNSTNEMVELSSPNVDTENMENYHVFHVKKPKISDSESRIKFIMDTLKLAHCTETEKNIIRQLVNEFHDVFHVEGDGLTFAKDGEHRIFTKPGANPVNTKQYKIPHELTQTMFTILILMRNAREMKV